MSLDTIFNMTISLKSRAPTQAGFGTPLLFGHHTAWVDRLVQEYSEADEMLDDGFTTAHPLYKAAQIVKSQDPSPSVFKIGRRQTALTQVVELEPKKTTAGYKYKGTIGGKAFSYTVLGGATTSTIATAIAAAIDALAVGGTATADGPVVTFTATTPGDVIDIDFTNVPIKDLGVKDVTVDTTTDDELPEIFDQDDDWYGLLIVDSSSKATTLHGAGWMETKRKLFLAQTADTECADALVEDDVMSAIKDSSYARTGLAFHRAIGGAEWLSAAALAYALTTTPGAETMAFKVASGVKVDKLLPSEENAILAKNGSYYTDLGGSGSFFEGKSGAGEFMDTTRFLDWTYARMLERVVFTMQNNGKIPYTDAGVDLLRGEILAVILQGIDAKGFADTPAPTVTAPLVKNVPAADRINRILPDLEWSAQLAGAIHRVKPVRGRVSI